VAEGLHLTEDPIDPGAMAARIVGGEDGAVATFTGVVRNHHHGNIYGDYRAGRDASFRRCDLHRHDSDIYTSKQSRSQHIL